MRSFLTRVLRAERHEVPALAWAFAYFFLLLASYYVLRPLRDALAVEIGTQKLRWLFTATFLVMLALVPVFGWLCSRLARARLLAAVCAFFAVNLVAFALKLNPEVFFVWLSVFNLLSVSLFWSLMADVFEARQAARLYGTIAAGGSCGALAGPLLAAGIPDTTFLLVAAAVLLGSTLVCIAMLARWGRLHPRAGDPPPDAALGGSILAGARAALTSPFLLAICGYLLCYTALSTALYFQQVEIVGRTLPSVEERTRLFASVDFVVNGLTLALQVLAFSRLAPRLGAAGMLAVVPLVSLGGFLWLGAAPTLAALIAFGVTRRVGEFALSKPAREALFTVVPREERYKAKSFIDTVIYRGGDALAGWFFAGVSAFVAAGVAAAWTVLAFVLGARMKPWTGDDARSSPPACIRPHSGQR